MTHIRIQCPNCQTQGKLDASAVPDSGANIRCPACSTIFFVGGPESDDPTIGRAPATGASPVVPADADAPTQVLHPASEPAPADQGQPAAAQPAAAQPPASQPDAPDAPSAAPEPQAAPEPAAPQPQAAPEPAAPQPQAAPEPAAPQPQAAPEPAAPQPQAPPEPAAAAPKPEVPAAEPAPQPAASSPDARAVEVAPARARAAISVPKLGVPGMDAPAPVSAPDRQSTEADSKSRSGLGVRDERSTAEGQPPPEEPVPQPRTVTSTGGERVVMPTRPLGSGPRLASRTDGHTASGNRAGASVPQQAGQGALPRPPVEEASTREGAESEQRRSFRVTSATGSRRVVTTDGSAPGSGSHAAALGTSTAHIGSWRVRSQSGMVYDFPDTESLVAWLQSRKSLAGLAASVDGGSSFHPLEHWPELTDVEALGVRGPSSTRIPLASSAPTSGGSTPVRPRQHRSNAAAALQDRERRTTTSETRAKKPRKKRQRRSREAGERSPIVRVAVLGLLLAAVGGGAYAYTVLQRPPTLPDTPAGHEMQWVLDMMNGGAADLSEISVAGHFSPSALAETPAARIVDQMRFWDERYPGYSLARVLPDDTDTDIEIVVDTPLQDRGVISLGLEPNPPNLITDLRVRPYH